MTKIVKRNMLRSLDTMVGVIYERFGTQSADVMCTQLSAVVMKFEQANFDVWKYREIVTFYNGNKKIDFQQHYNTYFIKNGDRK